MNRYNWLICNENSTLWEDFYHTITLEPDFTNCNQYECSLDIRGQRLHIQCFLENPDTPQEIMYYHIDNETDAVIHVSGYHRNGQFHTNVSSVS